MESLHSYFLPESIFFDESFTKTSDEKVKAILNTARKKSLNIIPINKKELSKMCPDQRHQGFVAKIDFKTHKAKDIEIDYSKKINSYIYIMSADYEHNLGAIIRTSEVAGFSGVIIPPKVSITPVVVKASAGAVLHIPIFQESIYSSIKIFKDKGFKIFGIERNGEVYYKTDLTNPSLFIIGGEDVSVTENIQRNCDKIIEIPQFGKINSLNMSVAASIVIFEQVKQCLK